MCTAIEFNNISNEIIYSGYKDAMIVDYTSKWVNPIDTNGDGIFDKKDNHNMLALKRALDISLVLAIISLIIGGIMSSNQIDVEFAKSWDLSHGHFSKGVAERIIQGGKELLAGQHEFEYNSSRK